jgi:4-alpha-glucanotransferase
LADFALFMALKDEQAGQAWVEWPLKIRLREAEALTGARDRLQEDIQRHEFQQYVFFQQWARIREKAHALGIRIIGDIPIFVALDSADVWSNPGLFHLDEEGQPTVVAGVPPDYFSATGQRWGNPLYRWQVHADQGYVWWLDRLRAVLGLVDVVRLDHFRGFAGYWEIPASAETAVQGRWVAAPGMRFFEAVRRDLGELSIIAEDLGEITPDVVELRERFGLPGMKVLMFAFSDDPENDFLPHHHVENCVVYTGTHDNDTAEGWYQRVEEAERDFFRRYLQVSGDQVARSLIRAAWRSVARYALTTMQDLLDLDNEARMNYPGRPGGNWAWRMPEGALSEELRDWLREINYLYGRENQAPTTPAR